jgi:hypothetical protein
MKFSLSSYIKYIKFKSWSSAELDLSFAHARLKTERGGGAMKKMSSYSEARHGNAQDKILKGYKIRFGLTDAEGRNLHMFFSPTRIPKGMIEKEVREVLDLYSKRDTRRKKVQKRLQREAGSEVVKLPSGEKMKVHLPPSFNGSIRENLLPEELRPKGRMTRGNFRKGIEKFLHQIVAE